MQKMQPGRAVHEVELPGDFKFANYPLWIGARCIMVNFKNEPIFNLTKACAPAKEETACVNCEADLSKKEAKGATHCGFCGHRACQKCLYKKRKFLIERESERRAPYGDICRICDRKFFLRSQFKKHKQELVNQDEQIQSHCKRLLELQQAGVNKDKEMQMMRLKVQA